MGFFVLFVCFVFPPVLLRRKKKRKERKEEAEEKEVEEEQNIKRVGVPLYWAGCLPLPIHGRDPTTAGHGDFACCISALGRFVPP